MDTRILARLVNGDVRELETLLSDFRSSAQTAADELRVAFAAEDTDGVAAIAHRLKPSALWVGAMALGELCNAVENTDRTRHGQLEELIGQLEKELSRVDLYLAARQASCA